MSRNTKSTHLKPNKSLVADIGKLTRGNNQPLNANLKDK